MSCLSIPPATCRNLRLLQEKAILLPAEDRLLSLPDSFPSDLFQIQIQNIQWLNLGFPIGSQVATCIYFLLEAPNTENQRQIHKSNWCCLHQGTTMARVIFRETFTASCTRVFHGLWQECLKKRDIILVYEYRENFTEQTNGIQVSLP